MMPRVLNSVRLSRVILGSSMIASLIQVGCINQKVQQTSAVKAEDELQNSMPARETFEAKAKLLNDAIFSKFHKVSNEAGMKDFLQEMIGVANDQKNSFQVRFVAAQFGAAAMFRGIIHKSKDLVSPTERFDGQLDTQINRMSAIAGLQAVGSSLQWLAPSVDLFTDNSRGSNAWRSFFNFLAVHDLASDTEAIVLAPNVNLEMKKYLNQNDMFENVSNYQAFLLNEGGKVISWLDSIVKSRNKQEGGQAADSSLVVDATCAYSQLII
jgi:hypothetical protein